MSLFGALFSGVSGIQAQSQALGIIADNIANVNTIGFKGSKSRFSTLVTQSATATVFSPGGVQSRPLQLVDRQGLLQASAAATDLAITGDGFFVANTLTNPTATDGSFVFTRAGSFRPDQNGDLVNTAGLFLQGWPIDANGNIPTNRNDLQTLQTVNMNALTGTAEATTTVDVRANLQSSQAISAAVTAGTYTAGDMAAGTQTPDFERSVQIFDSKGTSRTLTYGFLKDTAANQWLAEIYVEPASVTDAATHPNGLIASGTMAFNTDGSLDLTGTTAGLLNLTIVWNTAVGAANSTITADYGSDGQTDGITQFDTTSQLIETTVNGAIFGALNDIVVNNQGVVTALFDNGSQQAIFKLPIAVFANPNGLANRSGNAYTETDQSGVFNLQEAGVGAAGFVAPSSLESSTVDIAEEFTEMITAQRAFSAAGKIITTTDEMLDELIRLKR